MGFLGSDYPKLFFFSPKLLCLPVETPPNFRFGLLLRISSIPVRLFPILFCNSIGGGGGGGGGIFFFTSQE